MSKNIVTSLKFRYKMNLFCRVFYIIDKNDNYLKELTKDFSYTMKYSNSKTEQNYTKFLWSRLRVVRDWVKEDKDEFHNSKSKFSNIFDKTNFYERYNAFFPKNFDEYSFLDDTIENSTFESMIKDIKYFSENDIGKNNIYKNFKYITFYSNNAKKLIRYKILYRNRNQLQLSSINKNSDGDSEEIYQGEVQVVNDNFIISASNHKINVTLVFLMNKLNTFEKDAILGITVGVSKNGTNDDLLSKKVILSKIETIHRDKDVDPLLKLFLNEQQSLRIKKDDLEDLDTIISSGKTANNYIRLLRELKYQMSETKQIIDDINYINIQDEDSFFIPLLENYKTLESNIGRISDNSLEYKIGMSLIEVFKKIISSGEVYEKLKNSNNFRIDFVIDLVKYHNNIFFDSKLSYTSTFDKIFDLINNNLFSLTFIIENISEFNRQLEIIPNNMKNVIFVVDKKKVLCKNNGINPFENKSTVFIKLGEQLVISKPNGDSFIYTVVDRGNSKKNEIIASLNLIIEYREKLEDILNNL